MRSPAGSLAVFLAACAGTPAPPVTAARPEPARARPAGDAVPGRLPPVPELSGPLRLTVVYPDSNARIEVRDSSFVFGSVGTGAARLRINGQPVPVAPNGAWLAWLPFRGDSIVPLRLEAHTETDSASLTYRIRRARRFTPPPGAGQALWVDTTSLSPVGRVWWPRDEFLALSARASEGAQLELLLPDETRVPLRADSVREEVAEGSRAYRGVIRGISFGDSGPPLGPAAGSPGRPAAEPILLAVKGGDTLRVGWPLQLASLDTLPLGAELDDDRARRGGSDGITVGRTTPSGTYTWFFPTGTRVRVTGRINGDLRVALSRRSEAWVAAREAFPTPGLAQAVVGSVTLTPLADRVAVRIPAGTRLPFQIVEEERALTVILYGARSDVNWLRYGPADSLVALASTRQRSADELELRFDLRDPVWGYRAGWRGDDLVLEIRRPPRLDQRNPLTGLTLVVDPGHPPLGATGPSGLTEAEANLAVARLLVPLLQREGARVLLTRTDARPVDLWPRVRFADSVDAAVLVSIHNNALPDGVNPFTNNGSSVFYNHPRALPLARAIQDRLVARLGLRDLGVGRGDLALARPTWMPAVLCEGLFMMIPEQEAALRQPEGARRYALAILEGLRTFLARRAGGQW